MTKITKEKFDDIARMIIGCAVLAGVYGLGTGIIANAIAGNHRPELFDNWDWGIAAIGWAVPALIGFTYWLMRPNE